MLVAEATDPDWVPLMKRAAGIVTDHGGATSHAAIVSRELGLPAVVGTQDATGLLRDGQEVTLSCAEGDAGRVYDGALPFDATDIDLGSMPATRTAMMLNLASPAAAFRWWRLPAQGVGLARMEFIVSNLIKAHPMALLQFDQVQDREARRQIEALTRGFADKAAYFVDTLARGVARIAAPVPSASGDPAAERLQEQRIRPPDRRHRLRTGGGEPDARAARRVALLQRRATAKASCWNAAPSARRARRSASTTSSSWCRSAARCGRRTRSSRVMAEHGLRRGEAGLQVYVMCEIPRT